MDGHHDVDAISLLFGLRTASADDQICDKAADVALEIEDYPTAILLHHRVLQSDPNNALAHYHLGFAYAMSGKVGEEINEHRRAESLGLQRWDLFLNLGLAYLGQRLLSSAVQALEDAEELGPEHEETHFDLAIAYERQNRLVEALGKSKSFISSLPKTRTSQIPTRSYTRR